MSSAYICSSKQNNDSHTKKYFVIVWEWYRSYHQNTVINNMSSRGRKGNFKMCKYATLIEIRNVLALVTECSYYLQSPQPADWAFSSWGLSGNGTCLSTSRKMRLPLLAVAPPAAPTISVIQRCQLLTPQSHSSSPLENLPSLLRRAAKKQTYKQKKPSLALFDNRSNVGDGKLLWFDWSDSNMLSNDSVIK